MNAVHSSPGAIRGPCLGRSLPEGDIADIWVAWQWKARRELRKGLDWHLVEAARIPEIGPTAMLRLRGGIAQRFTRGPKKGQYNLRSIRMRDCDTVYLSRRQLRDLERRVRLPTPASEPPEQAQ